MDLIEDHLDVVERGLLRGYSLSRVADWIVAETFLKGEPYSFVDHEFQERIARDMAQEVVVRKCSQIGLSELSARIALAFCATMPGFTTIYTMPTANDARNFAQTRIDPIISGSPALKRAIDNEVNKSEIKQFLDSFLYIKGTKGASAAISVPADALVHDEVDFSDSETVSNYESRLTHSKFKLKRKFSTPTVPGRGITEEYDTSKRHWNFVKCCHCNYSFVPDYFKHVRVPGYTGELRGITKENLWQFRWREAYLECPNCAKEPDLSPPHREWVVENTDYTGDKNGYQVQPFDAPAIITPGDLIKSSTRYERYADFTNFNLGLPAEDAETGFQEEELKALFKPRDEGEGFAPYASVMGIDVGLMCNVMIGGIGPRDRFVIQHAERVPHDKLKKRKGELAAQFRVRATLMDSQPYYNLLHEMQLRDPNLWGAIYVRRKDIEVMDVRDVMKDDKTGQEKVRMAAINRDLALDMLMAFLRGPGNLHFLGTEEQPLIIKHLMDMKRVRDTDADGDAFYSWKKSASGNDHYHHTLLYCLLAARLLGAVKSQIILPFGVTSFNAAPVDSRGNPVKGSGPNL